MTSNTDSAGSDDIDDSRIGNRDRGRNGGDFYGNVDSGSD